MKGVHTMDKVKVCRARTPPMQEAVGGLEKGGEGRAEAHGHAGLPCRRVGSEAGATGGCVVGDGDLVSTFATPVSVGGHFALHAQVRFLVFCYTLTLPDSLPD